MKLSRLNKLKDAAVEAEKQAGKQAILDAYTTAEQELDRM